jgi:2-methylaconitate cis-trans-isomerase PrpF
VSTVRYSVITPAAVALAAATTKTILNLIAPASFGLKLVEYTVSFDGVTGAAAPVLVEVCQSTQAGAGTPAASPPTPVQYMGRTIAHGITVGHAYTAEPTVLTPIDQQLVDPYKGLFVFPIPEDESFETDTSGGTVKSVCIRCNAPAIVNTRVEMRFERL